MIPDRPGCPRHRRASARRRTHDVLGLPSHERARHYGADAAVAVYIGLAVAVVAAGTSAYMQYQQGQYAADVARYNQQVSQQQAGYAQQYAELQARMLEQNGMFAEQSAAAQAAIAERQAEAARNSGRIQEEIERAKFARQQSRARANIGASGVNTEGSPLLVLMDNAAEFDMDMQRLRYGTELEAMGHQMEGQMVKLEGAMRRSAAESDAKMSRFSGRLSGLGYNQQSLMFGAQAGAARWGSYWGAGTTLLAGVGNAASRYPTTSGGGGGTRYYWGGGQSMEGV